MKNTFQRKGFTLIELLVVIVILGILSTISVGTFRSYFAKARDAERVSAVQNLAMMMKVGSGGDGDCTVYDYTEGGTNNTNTPCPDNRTLLGLIEENDYRMPEPKSGMRYFYGFLPGTIEGDNDFFIVVAAEEDDPQNGTDIYTGTSGASSGNYIFVDGTRTGIDALVGTATAAPLCTWNVTGTTAFTVTGCPTGWVINEIDDDGSLE